MTSCMDSILIVLLWRVKRRVGKNITIEETVEYSRVVKISFGFNARRGVTNIFTNVSLNLFLFSKIILFQEFL